MRQPDFLKPGDKVGIVAPARKVTKEDLGQALEILEGWGYIPVEGRYLYGSNNQFSGTDDERRADMQDMINDTSVKAILAARGGYGCMRIVDQLDFTPLKNQMKWIAGFSDITAFHSHLHNMGIQSLHSIMAFNMMPSRFNRKSVESFCKALSGVKLNYNYKSSAESKKFQRKGSAEGQVVGGNLSLLFALSGSSSDISTDGKILFIEDLDEYLYHIDRMMLQLKRCGKLQNLAGLIVGGMNDMKDNETPFGMNPTQIIAEAVKDYSYPVCFDFPAGHQDENYSLIFGANAALSVDDTITLQYI